MAEPNDPTTMKEPPEATHSVDPGRHSGLLWASAILATAAAIAAGVYGIQGGLLIVKALALQLAMAAATFWLSMHAARIRRRMVEAEAYSQGADGGDRLSTTRFGGDYSNEDENSYDIALGDREHARMQHCLLLAVPACVIFGLLAAHQLWTQTTTAAEAISSGLATALAIVALAASCVWLVFARTFAELPKEELPEAKALALASRETHWMSILVAAALLASLVWAPVELWVARVMFVWVVAICVEQLVRAIVSWVKTLPEKSQFVSPVELLLREAVFVRGNPIASAFEVIEERFGLSFRSSWAIRFVRMAVIPVLILAALMLWALSSLTAVGIDQMGVRESFGRVDGEPLGPGLHLKYPWPFGRVIRYPVKEVFTKPVGFVIDEGPLKPMLWSKAHAKEEFALVLGDYSEAVAVDAIVYYKIREDKEGFFDYVFKWQDDQNTGTQHAVDALEAFAYRALMEQTRSKSLTGERFQTYEEKTAQADAENGEDAADVPADESRAEDVLSASRAAFADELKAALQRYAEEERLGIKVIDVALLSIHPPLEAAPDYLDVISAAIDKERTLIEADSKAEVALLTAEGQKSGLISSSAVAAADRVGKAIAGTTEFEALRQASTETPDAFRLRLWYETVEKALGGKRLFLLDKSLITQPGQTILDMRPNGGVRDSFNPGNM